MNFGFAEFDSFIAQERRDGNYLNFGENPYHATEKSTGYEFNRIVFTEHLLSIY